MSARDKARWDWITRSGVTVEHHPEGSPFSEFLGDPAWIVFEVPADVLGEATTPRQAVDAAMREDARRQNRELPFGRSGRGEHA